MHLRRGPAGCSLKLIFFLCAVEFRNASPHRSMRVHPLDQITMQKAEHMLESSQRRDEVVFAIGQHHLTKNPLCLRSSDATLVGEHHRDGGARGGEGEVRIHGSWHADGAVADGEGKLENLLLIQQRSKAAPRDPVKVFGIDGGQWSFIECEVTGAGTGISACGLMEIGGDGEYGDEEEGEEFERVEVMNDEERNPVVRIQSCLLRKLPDSELLEENTPLHHLLYIRNHSLVDVEDSELNGGDHNALFLYDDSLTRVRGSLLRGARCSVGIDDSAKLVLEDNNVRDNGFVFHLWSHLAALEMRRNIVVGQVFEDMDRFTNSSLIVQDNTFTPDFDMRAPGFFNCEGCGEPQYFTTLDRFQKHKPPSQPNPGPRLLRDGL